MSQLYSSFSTFWFNNIWVGQKLTKKGQITSQDTKNLKWYQKYRKILAIGIPCCIVWITYFTVMSFGSEIFKTENDFDIWTEIFCPGEVPNSCKNDENSKGTPRYYMTFVMIFGSLVAGATSEGGGAIAFPFMTLVFSVKPTIARDFSLVIQSVGMTSALFTIFFMKVRLVQLHVIVLASISSVFGISLGLEVLADLIPPIYIKMWFAVVFGSFAIALFLVNRHHDRQVFEQIADWNDSKKYFFTIPGINYNFNWRSIVIIVGGFVGGILTALTGSGMDICLFSVLTLLFRVSEKTATPTSVVLMGINTVIGFLYRLIFQNGLEHEAYRFLAVCAPVVVVGAPFGSYLSSNLSRIVLAWFIYILDAVQFIGALVVLKPWNKNAWVLISSGMFLILAVAIFWLMNWQGLRILNRRSKETDKEKEQEKDNLAFTLEFGSNENKIEP